MPKYSYTATDKDGKKVVDTIDAKGKSDVAHILQGKGLRVLSVKKSKNKEKRELIPQKIKLEDRIFFTQNLYIMIRTGFSLADALKTLSLQASNKRFKTIIETMRANIEKGMTLSKSMEQFPKVFNELFVSMVAAGEISGKLEDVLQQLTIQLKKDHDLMAKVKSALTYPTVILIAMVILGVGMIVYVIPQITGVFESANVTLPLPTRIVIGLSDALVNYGLYIFVAGALLVYLYSRFLKTVRGKLIIHKIALKAPIIGPIIRKINIARFTRTLSSLLKTDIPIVQTFKIIERTLGNVYYRKAMAETSEKIKQGVTIVNVLKNYPDLFPPILTQMISVGEQSGTLELIAEEVAVFYEDEVTQTMIILPTILEPVIMLIIGAAAGLLVAAIILPIYSLGDAL